VTETLLSGALVWCGRGRAARIDGGHASPGARSVHRAPSAHRLTPATRLLRPSL